jgi:hypothetical protein
LNNEKEYFIPFSDISCCFLCYQNKKPEQRSKLLKGFSTYYNTLFNAKDALNSEFTTRDKGHKDNFYAPYIPILTYEEQPLGSDLGQSEAFAENSMKMAEVVNRPSIRGNGGIPNMQGGPGRTQALKVLPKEQPLWKLQKQKL